MDAAAARSATEEVPGIPRDDNGPVFRAPWEAHAFAMALTLHKRGVFSWTEWAATLADEIKRAQAAGDPDTGETYYRHWLATLERRVAEKGVTSPETLHRAPMGTPCLSAPDSWPPGAVCPSPAARHQCGAST